MSNAAAGLPAEQSPPRAWWRRRLFIYPALVVGGMIGVMLAGCADMLLLMPSTHPIPTVGQARLSVPWERGEVEVWVTPARGSPRRTSPVNPPENPARPSAAALPDGAARATDAAPEPAPAAPMPVPNATRLESAPRPFVPEVDPIAFVLEFNGNAERAEGPPHTPFAVMARAPVEVWRVNFPGYGGSTGPARLRSIPPAALAVFDALHRKAAGRPIVIFGFSLGGTAALHVAAERPGLVAGVVLANTPPLRRLILQRHGWWNLYLLAIPVALSVPAELNALDTAPRVNCPVLAVSAMRDGIVPASYQALIRDALAGPVTKLELPDADHNDPPRGGDEDFIRDWIMERLGMTAGR